MSKERPILFSGPMVRAILAGRKTETRRLVRNPPPVTANHAWVNLIPHLDGEWAYAERATDGRIYYPINFHKICPYGPPGNLLWVREAWRPAERDQNEGWRAVEYKADGSGQKCRNIPESHLDKAFALPFWGSWRPSIHMPRWAARIFLRVEEVGVERLQEITEEGAKAEGVGDALAEFPAMGNDQRLTSGDLVAEAPHRAMFAILWDEINGDRALWKSDPWVWVVRFSIDESTTAPSGEGSP